MICFYFFIKKADHDFILMIKRTEYVLFPEKHNDHDFCQINEKHNTDF